MTQAADTAEALQRIAQALREVAAAIDRFTESRNATPPVPPAFVGFVPARANVIANAIDALGRAPEGYTEREISEAVANMRKHGLHNFKTGMETNIRNGLQRNCPDSKIFKSTWQAKGYAPVIIRVDRGIRGKTPPRWGLAEWFKPVPLKRG